MTERHTGGCLCGHVRYAVDGPLRGVVVCHCTQCQRLHGGPGPHTKARNEHLAITTDTGLGWYRSSDVARRGYCRDCGSSLFWAPFEQDATGILAGSLDDASGLEIIGHIFVGEKPGYYEITDDRPRFEASSDGALPEDFR